MKPFIANAYADLIPKQHLPQDCYAPILWVATALFAVLVLFKVMDRAVIALLDGAAIVARILKSKQFIALAGGAFLLCVLLFPAWRITINDRSGHTERTEIAWSFLMSQPSAFQEQHQQTSIAVDIMVVEFAAVTVAVGTLIYVRRISPHSPIASVPPRAA